MANNDAIIDFICRNNYVGDVSIENIALYAVHKEDYIMLNYIKNNEMQFDVYVAVSFMQ